MVRTPKELMLAGEPYRADDPELAADGLRAAVLCQEFNTSPAADPQRRHELLVELLGAVGAGVTIRPPLHVDYGYQIRIGAETFVNFGTIMLDVASITIGRQVQIGPYVALLTPTHPLDPDQRRDGWESARPIVIGDNVWLGGGAVVGPGVTIGENTVVGAGSIVVRDLPANVMAVGNPARIVRELR